MLKRSLAALFTLVLLLTACSGGDDKAKPTDEDPQAILEKASTALAAAKSFHFHLTHENGATPMPLNLQLTEAEGDVAVPDRVAADIKAKAASLTASVKFIGIGDRTWITNPFNRQWQELPNTSVRDIANPAALVKSVISDVKDAKLEGQSELDGVQTYHISGAIDSSALDAALPNVQAGLPVTVQVWVGVDDSLPRRARVVGRLSKDEPENIVRQIDLSKFNAAVTIQQPQGLRRFSGRLEGLGTSSGLIIMAGLGVFLAAADQTSVVAVLPRMIDDVGLAQDQFYRAAWIVNGYILGYVVAMPLMGRLADTYGRSRIYTFALLLFTAGSAWVALSGSLTSLTIARTVQAAGGGALVPVALSIVAERANPLNRAVGLGAMAAAAEAGGLVGPLWGGVIAEVAGWRSVFLINLPLTLPLAYAVWQHAREELRGPSTALDLAGALLLGGALTTLTVALTDDPIESRPLSFTLLLFAATALLLAAFVWRQLHVEHPILDMRLLRVPALSAAFLVNALVGGALIVAMVNVPLFTNVILEGSALDGGLNLMRLTLALAAGAFLGGVLANRVGFAYGAAAGLVCAGIGLLGMSRWGNDPSFIVMSIPLLVAGLGFGLVIAPVSTAVIGRVAERDRATMASLLTVVRLVGALIGVALLTTQGLSDFYTHAGQIPLDDPRFAERVVGLQLDTFKTTFTIAAGVCFLTVLPALLLGRNTENT